MRGTCPYCEKETVLKQIAKQDVIKVQGENIEVEVNVYLCPECGGEFEDPQSSIDPLDIAYQEFRKKHGFLRPEEIREARKRFGLTQAELSELLGWGGATLSRYENGALQDETHDRALRLAIEPRNLLTLINQNPSVLPADKRDHLVKELKIIEADEYSFMRIYEERFGSYEQDIMSGYLKLDIRKLLNAILFFCKEGVLKTKLNKLLFYADFVHYREYAVSITGSRYAHIPFGPAPDKYSFYFADMVDEGMLSIDEKDYNGVIGEVYKSLTKPDLAAFSDSELKVMLMVMDKFRDFTANQISDLSHKEKGYIDTRTGEMISYEYAEDIKAL